MKKFLILSVIFAFTAAAVGQEEFVAKLTKLQGKVTVKTKSSPSFSKAATGTKFTGDTTIQTGPKSEAELLLRGGTIVTVKESSVVVVNDFLVKQNRSKSLVGVCAGRIDLAVKKLQKDEQFEVMTPTAVAGVRGTKFKVEALPDGSAVVNVDEGAVAVAGGGNEATLAPGQNAGVNFYEGSMQTNVNPGSFADDRARFLKDNPAKVMGKMADQMEGITTQAEGIPQAVNTNNLSGQASDYQRGKDRMAAFGVLSGQIAKDNKKNPDVQSMYNDRVKRINDRYNQVAALIEERMKRIDQLYEKKSKEIDDRFNNFDKTMNGSGDFDKKLEDKTEK